ncbi:MAG: hypothetical protein PHU25_09890 [Deltaproteobacteria bacterium]|nr:hypothetical protein [Deltaproteobacteria bacterium]
MNRQIRISEPPKAVEAELERCSSGSSPAKDRGHEGRGKARRRKPWRAVERSGTGPKGLLRSARREGASWPRGSSPRRMGVAGSIEVRSALARLRVALGDFNIDRAGDPCYDAFVHDRLFIPPALHDVPRTITDDPKKPSTRKFYDQIACFEGKQGARASTLACRSAGTFDFRGVVMRGLETEEFSWRMSDHLPLWVEFGG